MNKKKAFMILGIMLVLLIVGTVTVIGIQNREKPRQLERDETVETDVADKQATVGDSQTALVYTKTLERADGTEMKYFSDADDNQYMYDEYDHIVGYRPNPDAKGSGIYVAAKVQGQADIEALAKKYGEKVFGEEVFSKFSITETVYKEDVQNYDVYFHVRYQQHFITDECIATVNADGTLVDIIRTDGNRYADFDSSVLNEVDAAELKKQTVAQLQSEYAERKGEFTADVANDVGIDCIDGKTYAVVTAVVTVTENGEMVESESKTVRFELKK